MNKKETHVVQGMSRDMSVHKFNPNLVADARNIRITTVKNNSTLLSVTNEKGTAEFSFSGDAVYGTIIGTAVINNTLVLFTTQNTKHQSGHIFHFDRIYKLVFTDDCESATSTMLFEGDLNLDYEHPIETLPFYENEFIQKVYWVDGKNQPRMINIVNAAQSNPDIFNFNREIEGKQTFEVTKYPTGGEFPAGTIQYCFNYFNKFGQETNIVDQSPMYYLCPTDVGLPADTVSNCSFVIKFTDLDPNYEYVRLYSIIRTSENATPNVRIVGDYKIGKLPNLENATIVGASGQSVTLDTTSLYLFNIITGTLGDRISDLPSGSGTLSLEDGEYIYDTDTGYLYSNYTTSLIKVKSILYNLSDESFTIVIPAGHQYANIVTARFKFDDVVSDSIVVSDNGVGGSTLDAEALLFVGGQEIIAGTITTKDKTLFLGNLKHNVPNIGSLYVGNNSIADLIRRKAEPCVFDQEGNERTSFTIDRDAKNISGESYYDYTPNNDKSSYNTKSFKARENYRLGLIAQYKTGQWSEVLWIDDLDETYSPGINVFSIEAGDKSWGQSYRKPGFKADIPSSVINALRDAGFIRIAPVVVYPNSAERKVLYQGLLAGTVYNVKDRLDNSPYVQADWRFRSGYNWNRIEEEIQFNYANGAPEYPLVQQISTGNWVFGTDFTDLFSTEYYRDASILTFHSPDIEASDIYEDLSKTKLRIVGVSNLRFNYNRLGNLYYPTPSEDAIKSYVLMETEGFSLYYSEQVDYPNSFNVYGAYTYKPLSYGGYKDLCSTSSFGTPFSDISGWSLYNFTTYLWHRNGSLGAGVNSLKDGTGYKTAILKKKCIAELRYARTTFFQASGENSFGPKPNDIELNITEPKIITTDNDINSIEDYQDDKILYYGNIDKVLTYRGVDRSDYEDEYGNTFSYGITGYPIGYKQYADDVIQSIYPRTGYDSDFDISMIDAAPVFGSSCYVGDRTNPHEQIGLSVYGTEPISIKYKSQKHLVFGLLGDDNSGNNIYEIGTEGKNDVPLYWKSSHETYNFKTLIDTTLFGNDNISETTIDDSVLVGELYREFTDEQLAARFGGTSQDAITNNIWVRCGDSVYLNAGEAATLYFKEGDTYIGRYDCMKTYPYTEEDQNQIVSIYSTELESRVNLDARYDKNRGLVDNTFMRPTNFNLYNHPGYEQTNQYFTYKAIDYDRYKSLFYPNMLAWTLEKKAGEDVDTWTSVPLTSTADVQGTLGEITKLIAFNDSLFSFQRRGVAQILYNERTQIPTSDGQPIEITNGLKFGGLRYLSDQIGMTNKWSLCTTPSAVYFIDDEKNILYQFNGQQFQELSNRAGFSTWLADVNSYKVWNPVEYGNIRTFYDKLNGDVYFVSKDESLVFSEPLNAFTSFMDYDALPALVNVNDKFFTFKKDSDTNENTMWELFAGDFNMFFGEFKPYWLIFVSNSDPSIDKIYNWLSWRTFDYSDVTDDFQGNLQPLRTFDTIRVWHDHQNTGDISLYDTYGKPSSLKKKFNVFRALVPRDKYGDWANKGMNRIRNTWAYIKLARNNPNTDFFMFSDLDVNFFE